jgi:hypothetical protein
LNPLESIPGLLKSLKIRALLLRLFFRLKDYLSKEGERKVAAEEKQKNKLEKLRYKNVL